MSEVHHGNIFKSMKDIQFEDTISHQCGVTMNDSVEARAIAEVMEKKPNVTVTYLPSMIRDRRRAQESSKRGRDERRRGWVVR